MYGKPHVADTTNARSCEYLYTVVEPCSHDSRITIIQKFPYNNRYLSLGDGNSKLLLYIGANLTNMHHLTFGINSLLHSVNLILFTLLPVHLILRISPHHSHHLRSHHLSLPLPFTPDLKLISFTNPFLHSHSYSFQTAVTYLNLYCI